MKIRSITYFLNPGWPIDQAALDQAGNFIRAARPAFQAAGYEVETARLATVPFPELLDPARPQLAVEFALRLEKEAQTRGFDYISIGPALPGSRDSYAGIAAVLAATQNVFVSGMLATPEQGVSLVAVRDCAAAIHQAATISSDGFANLRFAALANVPPGSPFFPAAFHHGDAPAFALATEAADLAVKAFLGAGSLAQARRDLVASIESNARRLEKAAFEVSDHTRVPFAGLDFSLAPFPAEELSIGKAIELLGAPGVGLSGSLAAAAFLADTLDRARFTRAGFSGLMLPVMEDAILAARCAQGLLSISDLLLYSAVCGTGLDTLPLPGDASVDQLAAVLLDLAALSARLGKPLTARLMPIPGKAAGDPVHFEFGYFADSRILPLPAAPLERLFLGDEQVTLQPHSSS